MAECRVIPFHVEHYLEAVQGMPVIGDPTENGRCFERAGPAWTGMIGDAVAGCAGVALLSPGVGEAWAVLTPLGLGHMRWIHRAVRDALRAIIAEHRLRRVQARVIADFFPGRLWAAHLGFREESRMFLAAPGGRDFIMCAMYPKGGRG
jgi:hypothetical protein